MIIDCDVHPVCHDSAELQKHLPRFFRELGYGETGHLGHSNPHGVHRRDSAIEHVPGADSWFDVYRAQLLEAQTIDCGILNFSQGYHAGVHPNPDYAAALCTSVNAYIAEHWLPSDPRWVAAIVVAPQDPKLAVEEIRRCVGEKRFVGISMTPGGEALGHRRYWPIYEAAAELGLPISIHPGSEGGPGTSRPFATGYAETYMEWHCNLPTVYMTHLTSLVTRGVLTTFPTLRFVMLEGGFGWLPHLLWRMDKNWKALRATVPFLKEPPSRYVLQNVRLSTQPIEEPPKDAQLLQIFEMMQADRTLMFSSDYPHWDNDDVVRGLPRMEDGLKHRILAANALETYTRIKLPEIAHA